MDLNLFSKKYTQSIIGKIIITILLACGAIALSLYISRFTFTRILTTVDKLSKPNEKIQLVNKLFKEVINLDHLQRNQALKTQAIQYNPFLKESGHLQHMLDSLHAMDIQNTSQVSRIDSMKKILYNRDLLFLRYLKLHTELAKNDTLAGEVKNLSQLIAQTSSMMDSNFVTTSKVTQITIDTLKQEEEKQSLWNRLFPKKKPKTRQIQKQIEEKLNVRVDTLPLGKKGDSLVKIGKAISQVETVRIRQRALLLDKEKELNHAGDLLVTQLMDILNEVENDELQYDVQQNAAAYHFVNKGIDNITAVLLLFISGTVILIILIFNDISRSNKYRKLLVAAKEEAEEAGRVKQRFLSNMSHELRTPLQTIIGISEQIKDQKLPRQQDLENIHQSSLHLLQIVNEVLDYSRIISGKYAIDNKPFSMLSLLDEVKNMIQVQTALKKLAFHYDVAVNADCCCLGDAFRLKQILLNLLGNAVKFTDTGSISLSVKEDELPDGQSKFIFSIRDTGTGISAKDQAIIFNQFEQGSNSSKKHGAGLGLSIVKALVEIQHGDIQVQSAMGEGTCFTISVGYQKTTVAACLPVADTTTVTGYQGHVWIVDDDPFILQLCSSILSKHNVAHTCFLSPVEALSAAFPATPLIVFLDIRMAEMDGITLCKKLRERPVVNTVKYIALTAQALPDEQEAILQMGFDGLVMKPFLEQDFMNALPGAVMPLIHEHLLPDLSMLNRMTGNDESLLHKALQSFIIETENDLDAANKCMQEHNIYGLAEALHKLASRCGQLGIVSLANSLREMEINLRENVNTIETMAKMPEITNDVHLAVSTIKFIIAERNVPAEC